MPVPKPVVVFTVGSLGKSLDEIGRMFELAGRPDMTDLVTNFLGNRAGDLKGINREKPFGVMLFLEEGLPPRPNPVAYIPVDSIPNFISTLELGPGEVRKKSDTEYEIGRGRRTSTIVFQDGYALMSPVNGEFLKQPLPKPEQVAAGLISRYDMGINVNLNNIAPGLRELFITYFRAQAETDLQQRDDEPAAVYKARRASGLSTVQLMEQILRDGEQLTIGVDSNAEGSRAALEISVTARPESEFSQFLKNIGGKSSQFEPLLSDDVPLSVSVSWNADRREREMLTGYVDSFRTGVTNALPETAAPAVEKMAQSLQATFDQGHINIIFQFLPDTNRNFVLIGGMKIVGAQTFGTALRDILSAVGEREEIESVQLDVGQYQNVAFHRLQGTNANDEEKRLYGGHPAVTLGVGNSTFWFGVGGDGVQPALEKAIDLASVPVNQGAIVTTAPFQLVFRMLPWMNLPAREGEDPIGRILVEESMKKGDDAVRIEVRPNETGGRIRIQFDESFIRLLGNALAQLYDRFQV